MKHRRTLQITSVLSVLLFSLHWTDEVARGIERGGPSSVGGLLILAVWLYAAVVLAERRSGLAILLLASFFGSVVPVLHMQGAGLAGGRIADSAGVFFWVWTLLTLGATAIFSLFLSAYGLWSLRQSPAGREVPS
jgi:hypothetical protein